jgi:hypothetical protein
MAVLMARIEYGGAMGIGNWEMGLLDGVSQPEAA